MLRVVHAQIGGGACGFTTEVTATSEDMQQVTFEVASPCEKIQGLAAHLPPVDAYAEIGAGFDGALHAAVRESLRGCCSGCIVPVGLYKAMQVAAGLALPADACVQFERAEG